MEKSHGFKQYKRKGGSHEYGTESGRRVRKKKLRIIEEKKRKQSGKKRKRENRIEIEACIGRPSFLSFLTSFHPLKLYKSEPKII